MLIPMMLKFFWLFTNFTASLSLKGPKGNSLNFIVIGDWGGLPVIPYTSLVQLAVAKQMTAIAKRNRADFILAVGDNFYFDGVKDVLDHRFKTTFENVYNNKSLQIPWLVLAGNHDHYGNASAQIAYSNVSDRWVFPDYFYTRSFTLPSKKSTVDIVMIDTVLLCGNTDIQFPYEQPYFTTKEDKLAAPKYWKWVENKLRASKANYLLVCGHYPVYSIASHGNTKCLVQKLIPLLEKYKVSAYFSGHDHNIQHIQVPGRKWQVEYFVSGAADFVDDSTVNKDHIPAGSLKFHWGKLLSLGALTYVEATDTKMTVTFVLASGDVLYNYTFPPRFVDKAVRDML